MTHVALLRGINVGGARPLPMADLRALATDLGLRGVRTYIASGNLVWDGVDPGSPAAAEPVAGLLASAIADRWGYDVPVVVRSRDELLAVRDGNPFPAFPHEKWLHVLFLDRDPTLTADGAPDPAGRAAVAGLDPDRQPGDRFAIAGRHVYVAYGNGSARSKVTGDWFERALGVVATGRNWRTLGKLIALADR